MIKLVSNYYSVVLCLVAYWYITLGHRLKSNRVRGYGVCFNNISVILWRSVLLVEETLVPRENHRSAACHWQKLSHNVVSSTHLAMSGIRTLVVIGTDCTGSWKSNHHTITTTTAPTLVRIILYSNAICLYRRIWLVTIIRTIFNLKVVTKGFSWKDPPSWKREILHVTFTTIHKNN